jgi:hypothetical protein
MFEHVPEKRVAVFSATAVSISASASVFSAIAVSISASASVFSASATSVSASVADISGLQIDAAAPEVGPSEGHSVRPASTDVVPSTIGNRSEGQTT